MESNDSLAHVIAKLAVNQREVIAVQGDILTLLDRLITLLEKGS